MRIAIVMAIAMLVALACEAEPTASPAPTNTPVATPTPAPTMPPTATPAPTRTARSPTPLPSATPAPTATTTPTPAPAALPRPSTQESQYLDALQAEMDAMAQDSIGAGAQMARLSESPQLIFDETWILATTTSLGEMAGAAVAMRELAPPAARLQDVAELAVELGSTIEEAVALYASGIDDVDPASMNAGSALLLDLPAVIEDLQTAMASVCTDRRHSAMATNERRRAVSQSEYGNSWPLTIPSATLVCDSDAVWIEANGIVYPLNGFAISRLPVLRSDLTIRDLEEVWEFNREHNDLIMAAGHPNPGVRISIGALISDGLQLCEG